MNRSLGIDSRLAMVFMMLGGASLLGACTLDTTEAKDPALEQAVGPEGGEDIAFTQQAASNSWTPYTSEEKTPLSCDEGTLVSRIQCKGSYCDEIRAYCKASVSLPTYHYWTKYFSEEDPAKRCDPGYWITGIDCKGSYCDQLSLECSNAPGFIQDSCHYTNWMSEENSGGIEFPAGYYARGVECNGSYCDNMRFYVCNANVLELE